MIEFICQRDFEISISNIKKMDYVELLKKECYFCIIINNRKFFEEPLFPINEFLYEYMKWDRKGDFLYNTIESDDNPLISFLKVEDDWIIDSVWKMFECEDRIDINELTTAIEKIYV